MSHPNNITRRKVRATGLGGVVLATGDVLSTSAAKRALVVDNGVIKLTYEESVPEAVEQGGAIHCYRMVSGSWVRATSAQYGDWCFFCAPFTTICNTIEIIEASPNAVEFVMTWTAHPLNVPYLSNNGIVSRTYDLQLIYRQGAVNPNWDYIPTVKFQKVVRLERDLDGYFIGYHSTPTVGPEPYALAVYGSAVNSNTDWGEREMGLGPGAAVVFSSAGTGFTSYHPAWGAESRWAAAEAAVGDIANHVAWCGLDDPSYAVWGNAAVVAVQNTGFPNVQTTGPWWVADIHYDPATPFCRYIAMQRRFEIGVWQFDPAHYGTVVLHFTNEWADASGVPLRFQSFIGVEHYIADSTAAAKAGYSGSVAFANEPTTALRTTIAQRASALVWPR